MAERYRGRDLLRAAGLSGAFLGRPRQAARRHPVRAALIALGLALVVVVTVILLPYRAAADNSGRSVYEYANATNSPAPSYSMTATGSDDLTGWRQIADPANPSNPSNLVQTFRPTVSSQGVVSANADLFTSQAGVNQDLGIYISPAPSNCGGPLFPSPPNPVAWKESGGYTTYAPASVYIQTTCLFTANTTYTASLWWKTNVAMPVGGGVFAGARGPSPHSPSLISVVLSPTNKQLVWSGISNPNSQFYTSDNANWTRIDPSLTTTFTPSLAGRAVLSGNADLFSLAAGTNQDLGLCVVQASSLPSTCTAPARVVAWEENGAAAAYMPIAALVQTTYDVLANQQYTVGLVWRTNQHNSNLIFAGAGINPYSPSSVVAQLFASVDNEVQSTTAALYGTRALTPSGNPDTNGLSWLPIGSGVSLSATPTTNALAYLDGNASLFVDASYAYPQNINPELGVCVLGGTRTGDCKDGTNVVEWKESGGAAIWSPDASFVEAPTPLDAGTTYTISLVWRANQAVTGTQSVTMYDGAGSDVDRSRSSLAALLIPYGAPSTPTNIVAVAGNASAQVNWTASPANGFNISSYTVQPYILGSPSGPSQTVPGTTTSASMTGLTNGTPYTFGVYATVGDQSSPTGYSNTVVPSGVSITKTVSPTQAYYSAGQVVTFTIASNNQGSSQQTVTGVTDALPDGIDVIPSSVQVNGSGCQNCYSSSNRTLSLPTTTIAPGLSRTVTYSATVRHAAPIAGSPIGGSSCDALANTATQTVQGEATPTSATVPLLVCDGELGFENWWTYVARANGSGGTASVNVANGNLVIQQHDSTNIQVHGHLGLGLTRTYNSEDSTLTNGLGSGGLTPTSGTLGKGWTFNVSDAGDLGGQGTSGIGLYVPSLQTALTPTAVTLIDQDGTRHVFQPNALTIIDTTTLAAPFAAGRPAMLVPDANNTVCIDQTFTPPAGVHLSLWRYIEVSGSCTNPGTQHILGFVSERPDRLRSEYSWDGHLVDLRDGAGNELRYAYANALVVGGALGPLTSITEPATGRALTFSAASTGPAPWSPNPTVQKMTATDAAGRITTYYSDTSGTLLTTSHLVRVVNPDGSYEAYTYGGCGGSADQLCSAQDPRGNATTAYYTTAASDGSTVTGLARVLWLNDRQHTGTRFSYSPATSTTGTTTVTEAQEQSVYKSIDGLGRVGEIDAGAVNAAALHTTLFTWDSTATGTQCEQRSSAVDNNLCTLTRKGSAGTPDETTAFTYNPEGQTLIQDKTNSPEHLITTWGYTAEYFTGSGSAATVVIDQPAGYQTPPTPIVTSNGTRPSTFLYYVSDKTAMLTPRGNSPSNQSTFTQYRTVYIPDSLATVSPDVAGSSGYCATGTVPAAAAATGNTGLLCEQDAPSPNATTTAATTQYTYDRYGQRLTMTTPKAFNETPHGQAAPATTYTYYTGGATDLSGHTVADGWLKAVTDPTGHFVAYGYDAAGNLVRTWDRNATESPTLSISNFPGTPGAPPQDPHTQLPRAFTETLYATGNDTTSTPFSNPWRFVLSHTDAMHNRTTYAVDANGNQTSMTPPNGAAETVTQAFDANDNLTQQNMPIVAPATTNFVVYAYDALNNKTSYTNADNMVTAYLFDAVNRLTTTQSTRGPAGTSVPGCHTSGQAGDSSALPANRIVCQTTSTYDSVDNVVTATDATTQATTTTYDAAHRVLTVTGPRQVNGTGTKTQKVYDDDGNLTGVCPPREFTEDSPATCPGGAFTTTSVYGPAGELDSQTTHRQADPTSAPTSQPTLTTAYSYDSDGNRLTATDPRGGTTTDTYSVLDRKASETGPRTGQTTTWTYDLVGNLQSLTTPPATQAVGGETVNHITAYTYDADNRVVDTVRGATSIDATIATSTDAAGGTNIRTRVYYDRDGHQVAVVDGRAFAGGALTLTSTQYMVVTSYDNDGRPSAQYVPRFDSGTTPDTNLSPTQASQCPTSNRPPVAPGVSIQYNGDVGVCVTSVQRDAAGNQKTLTPPTSNGSDQRYISTVWTDDNLMSSQSSPDPSSTTGGRVPTTYTYDADHRLVQTIAPDGYTTSTAYSADGLVASSTVGGHTTTYGYDASGNRTDSVDPAQVETKTQYYSDNLVGLATQAFQDTSGGTALTGAFRGTTAYYYDANGNVVQQYSPEAWAAHTSSPFARGTNTAGAPTLTTYTADNLVLTTTVPTANDGSQGRQTTYVYDPAGMKFTQDTYLVTGVNWAVPASPGTRVTGGDAGTQKFLYDQNGLLGQETGHDNSTIITTIYDAAGNQASVKQGSTGTPITSMFYLDSLPRTVTDTNGRATLYSYDGEGSVVARKDTTGGVSGSGPVTSYSYGDAELPASMTSAVVTGVTTNWSYTNGGLPSTQVVQNSSNILNQSSVLFYPDRVIKSATVKNGDGTIAPATWTYGEDAQGRINSQGFSGSAATAGGSVDTGTFTYAYDPAGRVMSFQNGSASAQSITWDHNGNRLSFATSVPLTSNYQCYNADNSIAFTTTGATAPVCSAAPPVGSQQSSYKPFGGLAADGCTTYAYDPFEHLSSATGSIGTGCQSGSASYSYDGLDRQISHSAAGATTTLHYDGLSSTASVETSAGVDATYALGPKGTRIALSQGATTQYLFDDGTGNISTVLDPSANVMCTARFDPFGSPVPGGTGNPIVHHTSACSSGTTPNDFFYRGARQDQTTNQYQFGSRTYDPSKGTFLMPDSYRQAQPAANLGIGVDPLTQNTYTYVNGDPVNLVDPNGHSPCAYEGNGCSSKAQRIALAQGPSTSPRGPSPQEIDVFAQQLDTAFGTTPGSPCGDFALLSEMMSAGGGSSCASRPSEFGRVEALLLLAVCQQNHQDQAGCQAALNGAEQQKQFNQLSAADKQCVEAWFAPGCNAGSPTPLGMLARGALNTLFGLSFGVGGTAVGPEAGVLDLGAASGGAGITVIGHYPQYVNLARELGADYFSVPKGVWTWSANKAFLDQAAARGDMFRLATSLGEVRPGSGYALELPYLRSIGYAPSENGLWMTAPSLSWAAP